MANWLVVGGGITGLFAARLLRSRGVGVTLVERMAEFGGLLRSKQYRNTYSFDLGTHIPAKTGEVEIDDLLFPASEDFTWRTIDVLKVGNYFAGRFNHESQFIDLRNLPQADYHAASCGVMNLREADAVPADLQQALRQHYGEFVADLVLAPLVERFYRAPLKSLAPNAHNLLGYGRVIAFDPPVSRRIKQLPFYDSRLAYNHYSEGASSAQHLYPSQGGVGGWATSLVTALRASDAELISGASIECIDTEESRISSVRLSNGQTMRPDRIVWTLPPAMLARLLGIPTEGPPAFVPTLLHHYVIDKAPRSDVHYAYCNDASMDSFRLTFYDNFQSVARDAWRVTVEACNWEKTEEGAHAAKVIQELRNMELVAPESRVIERYSEPIAQGFPVALLDMQAATDSCRHACGALNNVVWAGRSTGAFFMRDVLLETKRNIMAAMGS